MRIRRPFAEYELRALGRQGGGAGERVRCSSFDEAMRLLGRMQIDEPRTLGALLSEVDPMAGDGTTAHELLEHAAVLIARGLIEVFRAPLTPLSSEMPELFDLVVEREPFENEISDGVSVVADTAIESPLVVEVLVEVEPAPVLEVGGTVTPRPATIG
ncbi:hypothetical protein DB30_01547 [Enhygromyxa salina]|uniref:Uncharacterized protein n=1 Tax=Enhygromyxa salina TaxID=215803 RepID=A0A0C2CM78_9BACT|nr:hypothetical protein [Enhygromyxa salina]KIG12356.1 hypothetical protein DB30_01547 [Enhygromyxa salina]